ncbi:UNKNOWN [Stylonychia lemnae]|uniref:GT44 domain-containing protein n=1 Tax=Stylonychia lemnae TaxID=5949 RepID=A0A077ZSP5_STYLE|nr:UNKNOWN [Stylonychia lemnae]|eukprot:CDW72584.1 UNKNOWN [Stylonychia lemnae]
MDICLFSKTIFYGTEYVPHREITRKILQMRGNETSDDFDFIEYNQMIQQYQNRSFVEKQIVYKYSQDYKIPLISHRVWATDVKKPRELVELIGNRAKNSLQATYKYLDNSARKQGQKWTHILWVQDKELVPNTLKLFTKFGVTVRSVYELEAMQDERIRKQFEFYVQDGPRAPAAASDFIRAIAIFELGGMYFDNDQTINLWDYNINHYFDFVSTRLLTQYSVIGLANAFFAAKQGHPILENYIKIMVDMFKFLDEEDERSYTQNSCNSRTVGLTLFGTGPTVFTVVAYNLFNQDGNQDGLIYEDWESNQLANIDVIDENGQEKSLTIKVRSFDMMSNSWTKGFQDNQLFGLPELYSF